MSEDDETCLYCRCDVTRGQGVKHTVLYAEHLPAAHLRFIEIQFLVVILKDVQLPSKVNLAHFVS